ncbi:MAG: hypothetical protein U9Q76_09520, partial [candidate division WOR-3 bacterium]|nr:hypothetical protein [candidate division WOR-3 bacterium]
MDKIQWKKGWSIVVVLGFVLVCFPTLTTPIGAAGKKSDSGPSELAEALGLTPEEFAAFDAAVREHFCEKYPALQDWLDFPILYERK